MSVMEANHLPLEASNSTFGSEMASDPVLKNDESVTVFIGEPCFEKISVSTLTISTRWFGPAAIWTSGGAQLQLCIWSSPSNPIEELTEDELVTRVLEAGELDVSVFDEGEIVAGF